MPDQPDTATKPVKLRESCDSCLIAKVKCSKTRPLCGRCLANGAPCAYSPSSRSGKRNRHTNGVTKSINTSSPHTSRHTKGSDSPRSNAPPSASYLTRLMYPLLDEPDRSLLDPNSGPLGGTALPLLQETAFVPASLLEQGGSSSADDGVFDSSDFLPTPPFQQDDFMDFMQTSGPNPFFSAAPLSPAPTMDKSSISPSWTMKDNPYPSRPSFQSPLDMIPTGRASSSQTTPRPSAPPAPQASQDQNGNNQKLTSVTQSQPCDCFAACLHVLQSLHNHSALLSSTQQGGPPFDIVLAINREAMESCSTMLECSKCVSKSGRSISTMMLATIFGKVMSLYRAACFLRFGPTNSMHATAQLAFGAYTVTGENRQLLEIEILLLELKKVESILAIYTERFRDSQGEKDDETNVYNALTSYLDKNLHYIIDYLRMRKSGSSK